MKTLSKDGSSSISSKAIKNIIDHLRLEKNRDSTRRNYHTIWKIFSKFYLSLDSKPTEWEERLSLFAGYLINDKKKLATVKSYVTAVQSILREDNIEISEDRYLLNALTRACKYHVEHCTVRKPIQRHLLNSIIQYMDVLYLQGCQSQPYLAALYKAIFASAYLGLLRISELASGGSHPVLAQDFEIAKNKDKIKFTLRTSKTHWKDVEPQIIKFSSICKMHTSNATDGTCCPYHLLRQFVKLRPAYVSDTEAFLILKTGQQLH